MKTTQNNWEELLDRDFPFFPKEPIYGPENSKERERLKYFIRSVEEKARESGYKDGYNDAKGNCRKIV